LFGDKELHLHERREGRLVTGVFKDIITCSPPAASPEEGATLRATTPRINFSWPHDVAASLLKKEAPRSCPGRRDTFRYIDGEFTVEGGKEMAGDVQAASEGPKMRAREGGGISKPEPVWTSAE